MSDRLGGRCCGLPPALCQPSWSKTCGPAAAPKMSVRTYPIYFANPSDQLITGRTEVPRRALPCVKQLAQLGRLPWNLASYLGESPCETAYLRSKPLHRELKSAQSPAMAPTPTAPIPTVNATCSLLVPAKYFLSWAEMEATSLGCKGRGA